ncbi:hypothetical protein SAMN05660659_04134 [Pseudomonas sp. LAMO17WK12:I6]|jgi:hypothetical protein|uniref:hypothetical protein n=1 Tax=unclassified Pseudomonas TaxID=196821 RepID=UPI000BD981BB|nr:MULTISPECIES: hypothetical protein [unclassified Pseudomonas]SNY38256.1 hypothetical protein SAMN05660659_04134 [Pseudomonas sp. LAMO17WK12:I6]SNY38673.1 hypothetical protein SAMN05660455_04418 [Pseudomonas sp. LAMO17WK12:I5]
MTNLNEKILLLDAPEIPDALPNFPGSQVNLLPLSALVSPLKVLIPDWQCSPPEPVPVQVLLTLLLNEKPVADYPFTTPIDPALFPFAAHIPETYLAQEGEHEVSYIVNIGGNTAPARSTPITVDLTAPNFGNPGEPPQFPPEIDSEGITQQYLATHNDEVLVTIGIYMQQLACDSIEFHFGSLASKPVIIETVRDATSSTVIKLSGATIRGIGSGTMFAFYRLRDRAGNLGQLSSFKQVNVDLS